MYKPTESNDDIDCNFGCDGHKEMEYLGKEVVLTAGNSEDEDDNQPAVYLNCIQPLLEENFVEKEFSCVFFKPWPKIKVRCMFYKMHFGIAH